GTVVRRWRAPRAVTEAAFTPDGRGGGTAAADGGTLWEAAAGRGRLRAARGVGGGCSPGGRGPGAGAGAGIPPGGPRRRRGGGPGGLGGEEGEVGGLAFTPDGKALISGSADSTGLVWEVAPPAPRAREQGAERLAELWAGLTGADAARAFRAAAELEASPRGAGALLAGRGRPGAGPGGGAGGRWGAHPRPPGFEA